MKRTKQERYKGDIAEYLKLDRRNFPRNFVGSEKGECLIVGTGRCVWDDVSGLCETPNVMTINDMLMYWPGRIKHAYSNDIEQLVHWSAGRRRPYVNLFSSGWVLHSATRRQGDEYRYVNYWPIPSQGGSGLVAILVALLLGYDDVTVAGCPFDDSGHFFDPPAWHNLRKDRKWSDFTNETPDRLMERLLPVMRGRVKAVSGRLMEMLDG